MNGRLPALILLIAAASVASAGTYYLALGDSVAFGYQNTQSPLVQSNGDRATSRRWRTRWGPSMGSGRPS